MELSELLELSKGERAVIKQRIESILLERMRDKGRNLIRDIMDNFDDDLVEIIERVLKSGLTHGFINNKSRKFRIWRNRLSRKIRRWFE